MSYVAQKCGVCFRPPSIVLIYKADDGDKTRRRVMPVRNFSEFSDCGLAAEQLKNNPRHKAYLEGVSLRQLKKLYGLLRGHLRGESLAQSLEKLRQEDTIDPEEDLNKLDDKELAKRKSIMDELFEKNRKKKDDPDFVYDIEVEFPQDEQLESCSWDVESGEEISVSPHWLLHLCGFSTMRVTVPLLLGMSLWPLLKMGVTSVLLRSPSTSPDGHHLVKMMNSSFERMSTAPKLEAHLVPLTSLRGPSSM